MRKIFLLCCFFLFFFLFTQSPIHAADNFTTANDVTYTVAPNGLTHVGLVISLTNTSSQYYASLYSIKVGFDHIQDISARDAEGPIVPKLTKTDDGQTVELQFNQRVVGKGNTLKFNVSFDTTDVAQQNGSIWEINIPGLAESTEFTSFDVHVRVPSSFGKPAYIKPAISPNTNVSLDFTKGQLQQSGISLAFGNEQSYDFNLAYHVKNNHVYPVRTEIALPPTTNYQEVVIQDISPKPSNVIIDKDGNWLAQYSLLPSETKDIMVNGKALLQLIPKKQVLSSDDRAKYLKEQTYWQTSNEELKQLAATLKTPQAIYGYVVKTLHYDFGRVLNSNPRLGAVKALKDPQSAVCLEFTDLFITLARAAGIPSREVDGYAVTDNAKQRPLSLVKDVLHAWPEYYDDTQQTWIMVDPTWGNTTGGVDYFDVLDFDHITFAIKGIDSEYPISAGGYKLSTVSDTKDVNVSVSTTPPTKVRTIQLIKNIPDEIMGGFPVRGLLTFKNTGNVLLEPQDVNIESNSLTPRDMAMRIDQIPPFGTITSHFSFDKTPFLTNKRDVITMRVADTSVQHPIHITPLSLKQFKISGGFSYAALFTIIISVFAIAAGSVFIFRHGR